MTERHCKVCDGWHDLSEPWPHNCLPERNWTRSELACPHIATDTMQPVQSMLDGKFYDSKSALRRTYKQAGVTEVGNDSSVVNPKPYAKQKPKRAEVRAAVRTAFSRAGMGA
jgi:hypothetical protein